MGFDLYPLPGGKIDGNNSTGGQLSLGLVGRCNTWHSADEAGRANIWEEHKQYTLEFFQFLHTDPAVPPTIHATCTGPDLCEDEFANTTHFPPALYVRESRRMKGLHVISQKDIIEAPENADAIAISSFPIDSHDCQRVAVTISALDSILSPLATAFPSVPVSAITTKELEWYLSALKLAPRTLNNHRAGIIRLWNYAKGRYLPKDGTTAADAIEEFSEPERGAIAIFKPWEFNALLHGLAQMAAQTTRALPQQQILALLRTVALAGFTGARTVELCRMDASAVRLDAVSSGFPHGYLEIKKGVAKRHRSAARRLIPIQPNLAKWLEAYPFPAGPVSPYAVQSSLTRAISRSIRVLNRERARLRLPAISRPENGCRHSYATYRLPVLKSAPALAIEMNNSPAEIEQNYHELAQPSEVEAWWAIVPAPNIVQLDFTTPEKVVTISPPTCVSPSWRGQRHRVRIPLALQGNISVPS